MTDHTPPDDTDDIGLDGSDRRAFLKRAAIGAVAVPILTSFSMAGMNVTSAQTPAVSGTTTSETPASASWR